MQSQTTYFGAGLLVDDLATMVAFYRDVLGLTATWEGGDFAQIHTADGGLTLFFYKRAAFAAFLQQPCPPPTPGCPRYELALWLPSYAAVDAEYARLSALSLCFPAGAPRTYPFGIRNFYLADPEGNLLEIGSRRDTPA